MELVKVEMAASDALPMDWGYRLIEERLVTIGRFFEHQDLSSGPLGCSNLPHKTQSEKIRRRGARKFK
jgi:hypothetical protein